MKAEAFMMPWVNLASVTVAVIWKAQYGPVRIMQLNYKEGKKWAHHLVSDVKRLIEQQRKYFPSSSSDNWANQKSVLGWNSSPWAYSFDHSALSSHPPDFGYEANLQDKVSSDTQSIELTGVDLISLRNLTVWSVIRETRYCNFAFNFDQKFLSVDEAGAANWLVCTCC